MARWVLTTLEHEPGWSDLRVAATTNVVDHLWLTWDYTRPADQPIYRTVRGQLIFCGYKYIWTNPHIAEQRHSGDTIIHFFHLTNLLYESSIWYYLHAPNPAPLLETQGPLMHVLLLRAPAWSKHVYVATRTKGMYRTSDFSGPGGPQPTWYTDNDDLVLLDIRQATPDPCDPWFRRFVIYHGDVYRMENILPDEPATETLVLDNPTAVTLTGGSPGQILWIAGNFNYPGHFYVIFRSDIAGTGIWCIKTTNYGLSWTAHQINSHWLSYNAGNIQAGTMQGTSPLPAGDALHAVISVGAGGTVLVYRSLDEGETWSICPTQPGGWGLWEPRLYIEPSDQSVVYVGINSTATLFNLWRSLDQGQTWILCDAGNHLGIIISPGYATMGTHPQEAIRLTSGIAPHIWKSSDFGIIWRDQGPTLYTTPHLLFKPTAPDYLYLARRANAPPPGGLYARHTIFVSIDEGSTMYGKAGDHADQSDGGSDSIPFDCGGVAQEGVLTLP